MAARAVLFAVEGRVVKRLLKARGGDAAVMEIVEEVEEEWDEPWLCELDKAWDAIHRCLTDGELYYENGTYPLNHAVLGGKHLLEGDDYIAILKSPEQVKDVNAALRTIDDKELKRLYWRINPDTYNTTPGQLCAEDLEYTMGWLALLKPWYAKIAKSGRAVVFTVDQ